MNKYFKEVVTLKALDFKVGSPFSDEQTESIVEGSPVLRSKVKNVCAPIPLAMNDELEKITGLLGMSKGRFLTLAIASAIEEANSLVKELDVFEYAPQQSEAA